MRHTPSVRILACVALVSGAASCATYQNQLVRAQAAFERTELEQSLGLLRDLEPNLSHLSEPERAEYAYLRGMADYRIGYRADARHWLAIARAYDDATPGVLPTDWRARLVTALEELDAIVLDDGYRALTNTPKPL